MVMMYVTDVGSWQLESAPTRCSTTKESFMVTLSKQDEIKHSNCFGFAGNYLSKVYVIRCPQRMNTISLFYAWEEHL
jgi:hypothetical protein